LARRRLGPCALNDRSPRAARTSQRFWHLSAPQRGGLRCGAAGLPPEASRSSGLGSGITQHSSGQLSNNSFSAQQMLGRRGGKEKKRKKPLVAIGQDGPAITCRPSGPAFRAGARRSNSAMLSCRYWRSPGTIPPGKKKSAALWIAAPKRNWGWTKGPADLQHPSNRVLTTSDNFMLGRESRFQTRAAVGPRGARRARHLERTKQRETIGIARRLRSARRFSGPTNCRQRCERESAARLRQRRCTGSPARVSDAGDQMPRGCGLDEDARMSFCRSAALICWREARLPGGIGGATGQCYSCRQRRKLSF